MSSFVKDSPSMPDVEKKAESTKVSIHSIRNIFGDSKEFHGDKLREFANTHGVELRREITKFGMELTDLQNKLMEVILYQFSKTKYKGNVKPIEKSIAAREKYPEGNLPSAYRYLKEIPKLRIKQAELLQMAGIGQNSPGEIERALDALQHLGTMQYCFFYTRLAFDDNNKPKKESDGSWQMEEVLAIDTIFTIKSVRNKKTKVLKYYEICPSSIFLDQIDSYFMLIPFNWREEVLSLFGQRRASSYTFLFLLYLRYQFAIQSRKGENSRVSLLKVSYEEMAIILRMPESIYVRHKDKANKILEDACFVAKRLGYIHEYEIKENYYIFHLNESKFTLHRSKETLIPVQEDKSLEMQQAKELLHLIISEKRKLDPRYNPIAGGQIRDLSLKHLIELVKERPIDEIKSVIQWGIPKKYWCNRIGTPAKLRMHFSEAIAEKRAMESSPNQEQENRLLAKQAAEKINGTIGLLGRPITIEILNQEVEIGEGSGYPAVIRFSDPRFKEHFENALKKRGIKQS